MTRTFASPDLVVGLAESASTNDDAFAALDRVRSCLVWTTHQTRGRGSRGREWLAPKDCTLALSVGFHQDQGPHPGSFCYPLFAAVLTHECLSRLFPEARFSLKWPNDVLLFDRKLAGILCESRITGDDLRIVVGIGLNLRPHPQLNQLPKGYASLDELSRTPVAEEIVNRLHELWPSMLSSLAGGSLNQAWLSRCGFQIGASLAIHAEGRELHGSFAGLDADGGLLLRLPHGESAVISQSCDDFRILAT